MDTNTTTAPTMTPPPGFVLDATTPPEGFKLDVPTPPEGFHLDAPEPPAGFKLDTPAPPTGFVLDAVNPTAPNPLSMSFAPTPPANTEQGAFDVPRLDVPPPDITKLYQNGDIGQRARLITDLSTPPNPVNGVLGDVAQAAQEKTFDLAGLIRKYTLGGKIQQGEEWVYDQILPKPVMAFEHGAQKSVDDTVNFFTSPVGAATLGIGELPKAAQVAVSAAFTAQMAKQLPETYTALQVELEKPRDQRDWNKIGELITAGATGVVFTGMGGKHTLEGLEGLTEPPHPPIEPLPKLPDFGTTEPAPKVTTMVVNPEQKILDAIKRGRVEPPAAPLAPVGDQHGNAAALDAFKAAMTKDEPELGPIPPAPPMPPNYEDIANAPLKVGVGELVFRGNEHETVAQGIMGDDAKPVELRKLARKVSLGEASIDEQKQMLEWDRSLVKNQQLSPTEGQTVSPEPEPTPETPYEVSETPKDRMFPEVDKTGQKSLFEPPKVPQPKEDGSYGGHDWTNKAYPNDRAPKVRNGFLGIVNADGNVRGKWYADALQVDHTELGYKPHEDRFRYFPNARGGIVNWNFADEAAPDSFPAVKEWIESKGLPLRKLRGELHELPAADEQSLNEPEAQPRNDTPAPLRAAIERGTTVRGILTHLSVSDHELAPLAENLLRNGDEKSLGIRAGVNPEIDRSRWTTEGGRERVEYAPESTKNAYTVLEEAVHALTATKMGEGNPIQRIMEEAKKHIDPDHYAFSDARGREFIAQAIKDPAFQKALDAIKIGPTTLWQKLVAAIQRMIGVAPKNVTLLDEVLRHGAEIVKAERPSESTGDTLHVAPDLNTREKVVAAMKDFKAGLVPVNVDKLAGDTAGIVREHAANLARETYRWADAAKAAAKMFNKQTPAENLKFIDRMENGAKQPTWELQKVADALKIGMDHRVKQIQALGNGKLDEVIENYFPHIWTPESVAALKGKTVKPGNLWQRAFSKKPLEGSKSFLKQRTIPTTAEGVRLGLDPVSHNPVELALLKYREMDKYIMAQRVMGELKDQGLVKGANAGQQPDGWVPLNDKMFNYKYVAIVDGKPVAHVGNYYAPEPVARILNNYLSPGLSGYPIYDLFRSAGNVLNMAQLGLSAYHLTFTSIDSAVSKLALGIEQLSRGDILKGLGTSVKGLVGSVVTNPIENYLRGSKVLKEYTTPGSVGGDTTMIVDGLIKAGGRVNLDAFYKNSAAAQFMKAYQEANKMGMAKNSFGTLMHGMSYPIMQIFVPRMKLGIFSDMARYELQKNPTANTREVMGKIWDSVDNRMGQMVYDNLFWHKTLKDTLMASVRSVGWNVGTIRELGGAMLDSATLLKRIKAGDPAISHRMAYAISLPILVGTLGAMYQYMNTGKGPQELQDYFMPKTGRTNPDGSPERVIMPSYMKDIISLEKSFENKGIRGLADRSVKMAVNKIQPILSVAVQMFQNKDFYGTEIVNHDDSTVKQFEDYVKFLAGSFVPFSARNASRMSDPTFAQSAASFLGVMKPPSELTNTKAMQRMADYFQARNTEGGRTQEEANEYQLKKDLVSQMQQGKDMSGEIQKALVTKEISLPQSKNLNKLNAQRYNPSAFDGRILGFSRLPYEVAKEVFKLGTDEEKSLWRNEFQKKFNSFNKTHP